MDSTKTQYPLYGVLVLRVIIQFFADMQLCGIANVYPVSALHRFMISWSGRQDVRTVYHV
jgi:hypothetical protein